MTQRKVEFRTVDGIILRGNYFPVEQQNASIVIMTQGLTLLKESYIDDTAKRFQAAGIAALIYDHRGWGKSDAVIKNETDPMQQAEDYHDAVTFVKTLAPAIDPTRIGIWGIGHGGAAAMIAAGDDPRIKIAILNMPATSGRLDAEGFPSRGLEEAWKDREKQATNPSRAPTYVPVWDNSLQQAKASGEAAQFPDGRSPWIHGEVPYNFISGAVKRSTEAGSQWENKITLQSFYKISKIEPEDWISKIAPRSFLYLASRTDMFTGPPENHKRIFERANNPNAEFMILGDDHMANYFRNFEQSIAVQIDYLRKKL